MANRMQAIDRVIRGRRVVITLALVLLAILFLAWFDGGEEALHPIEQEVALPEKANATASNTATTTAPEGTS
ncbi:hypothetical protein [Qipengyuania spongiae]|uniref:Uncharacterized protein n=1 Tax=Qipengyuania spongiae TaxID=2909673 RepID=A0ABY5T2F2_9SPHN|nr:hypothetical protein [Qipengyuania spongiae]UVI39139.1 hypothetical protein L1F33_13035 [Qipengyuania spongiae]